MKNYVMKTFKIEEEFTKEEWDWIKYICKTTNGKIVKIIPRDIDK